MLTIYRTKIRDLTILLGSTLTVLGSGSLGIGLLENNPF